MQELLTKLISSNIGSTILQLPITLAIIGGLAVASTSLADVLPEARDTRRAADAYQVAQALALSYDDHLNFPIYTDTNAALSWDILAKSLEPTYIQELPNDPLAEDDISYRYWSDGQIAKVFYITEVDNSEQEHWVY